MILYNSHQQGGLIAETWGDILRKRGINPNKLRREREVEQKTCVVRALASIAGVEAPDAIVGMRLDQVNRGPQTFLDLAFEALELGIEVKALLDKVRAQEEQDIIRLIGTWENLDATFAQQVRHLTPQWTSINGKHLMELVSDGVPVIATGLLQIQGIHQDILGSHAMHVTAQSNTLNTPISLSDGGMQIGIKDNQEIRALVFLPRTETNLVQ